jgi:hypothetical protein
VTLPAANVAPALTLGQLLVRTARFSGFDTILTPVPQLEHNTLIFNRSLKEIGVYASPAVGLCAAVKFTRLRHIPLAAHD